MHAEKANEPCLSTLWDFVCVCSCVCLYVCECVCVWGGGTSVHVFLSLLLFGTFVLAYECVWVGWAVGYLCVRAHFGL